jgi:hypothetical protein
MTATARRLARCALVLLGAGVVLAVMTRKLEAWACATMRTGER